MSKQEILHAEERGDAGRSAAKKLRGEGRVPAILYGTKTKATSLTISEKEISLLLGHAAGESLLVDLEIKGTDGGSRKETALIQEVQHHPVKGKILHVDFHAVSMTETLRTEVPLEPVGEAEGVKNQGGVLEQGLRSLEIECLPRDLPDLIEFDISALKIGDSIHIGQLQMPKGVKAVGDPEILVAMVSAPRVQEEESTSEDEAPTEPEVIREKPSEEAES